MRVLFQVSVLGQLRNFIPEKVNGSYRRVFTALMFGMWGALALVSKAVYAKGVSGASASQDRFASFDMGLLKQRGIDPRVAYYFRDAAKFIEGKRVVSLVVNGVRVGRVDATFGSDGELVFDDNLLFKAHIKVPGAQYVLGPSNAAEKHYDFIAAYPQTELSLRPNKDEIFLVVPQEALLWSVPNGKEYSDSGTAALLNYDVMTMRSQFGAQNSEYMSAATEMGFNMDDWIVRSRQSYVNSGGVTNFQHLYAYAQRTFIERKAVVQAGEISIQSPLFSGGVITGMQVLPEAALIGSSSFGALVKGVALGQSTVEVRQAGSIIYTTIVPDGAFTISDIPLINSGSDLNVTVREVSGAERYFVVPAASFRTAVAAAPGYTFSAGRIRNLGSGDVVQPGVVTGTGTWSLRESLSATSGLMVADGYQSMGWRADTSLAGNSNMSVSNVYANASKEGVKGAKTTLSVNTQFSESLSGSLSVSQQTIGYRDLSDTLLHANRYWYNSRYQSNYNALVGWSNSTLGSFNVSLSPARTFGGDISNRIVLSWGKSFKHATISASLESALSGSSSKYGDGANAVYVSVSVPLGASRGMRVYASKRGEKQRLGADYNETVNDQLSYRLSTEMAGSNGGNYSSLGLSAVPRYTSLDLGYAQGGGSTNYNVRVSGGAVVHRDGVTFSPNSVRDTFGIVRVGDLSGVKISTPNGFVWTDKKGLAVVPELSAYRENRIVVQTKSLPRRVDLQNGFQTVAAGRGSVNRMDFKIIKVQRVLVTATDVTGQPLPKGASVLDGKNNFLTSVLNKGMFFISGLKSAEVLSVALPDEKHCQLKVDLPKKINDDAFYDVAPAVCTAL